MASSECSSTGKIDGIPTWPWASYPSEVGLYRARYLFGPYQCQLLDASIQLASEDEFGGVTSGSLTLRTKVWKWQPGSFEGDWRRITEGDCVVQYDYRATPVPGELALCLGVDKFDTVMLLIIAEAPNSNNYQRVGFVTLSARKPIVRFTDEAMWLQAARNAIAQWMDEVFWPQAEAEISIV
jgi:hypothetical protein